MPIYFQKPFAERSEGVPYSAAGEGFAVALRCFDCDDLPDNVGCITTLFSRDVSVSLEHANDIVWSRLTLLEIFFQADETMQNIGLVAAEGLHLGKKDVSRARFGAERRQHDAVFPALNEGSHADAGWRETHFLVFVQQPREFRNQYIVFDHHASRSVPETVRTGRNMILYADKRHTFFTLGIPNLDIIGVLSK